MSDRRKAAEMALKRLERSESELHKARAELRQALAKPEHEPVKESFNSKAGVKEAFNLDRGCWERGCMAYDERDGDGVNISAERVDETAKLEHEPVAWVLYYNHENGAPRREIFYGKAYMEETKSYNEIHRGLKCQVVPLYTAPPKREWVGLTESEIDGLIASATYMDETSLMDVVNLVEAKLKEKNGG